MFGLFDPPETNAQKRAAKAAQSLREQAVRDMLIELRMLINWQEQARQLQDLLFEAAHGDAAVKMAAARGSCPRDDRSRGSLQRAVPTRTRRGATPG